MNILVALLGLPLASSEFHLEPGADTATTLTWLLKSTASAAACSHCGQLSQRVQSRHSRSLADLPGQGKRVHFHLLVRRFFCATAGCPRRIFAERFPTLTRSYARTTLRLLEAHTRIGLALGSEAGSRLAHDLAMPTSPDILLRRVKQSPKPPTLAPRIVGIDDWAWRKGKHYGTILVDLERHQDEAAVAAAKTEPWSNGPVEGSVNRLKAIKRQMFGRAGFELLRARVLHSA